MSNLIPRNFIDEVVSRTDIVTLIQSYVPLRKKGANYMACCPFHSEKTPSFSVSPAKQIYHCFGCGVSGNAIGFLMGYERLSFLDAIELLAKQAGMVIPAQETAAVNYQPIYDIMAKTAHFYYQQIRTSNEAIQYLKGRGITGAIAKEFQLGYAPPGWENLSTYFNPDAKQNLISGGLLIKKAEGGSYDRFRHRIMFPIRDARGRVIGFGGRVLAEGEPKYLNSPETAIFHKGWELYGLFEAKKSCRELNSLIIVEGYMDVLALAQAGIRNVVGTLGTATTPEHLSKLLRLTQDIYFCFDGDSAGKEAAWRALQIALGMAKDGVQFKFIFLPSDEDPDSFVRKHQACAFQALMQNAMPLSEFLLSRLGAQVDLSSMDGKARFIQLARPLLEKMPDSSLKQMIIERLADITHLTHATILQKKPIQAQPHTSPQESLTPVRLCLALILQTPVLALLPESDIAMELNLPDCGILHHLIKIIQATPQVTTGLILEQWRDHDAFGLLSALAVKEHHIPVNKLEIEYKNLLDRLLKLQHENQIETLFQKARITSLSDAEKILLQKLIHATKGVVE